MAANVLVDAGFLVALLTRRDANHRWAATMAEQHFPVWNTCEGALSEAFHLLGRRGAPALSELLSHGAVISAFRFNDNAREVLALMRKYVNVPISFADACLVRMTEIAAQPVLLTTDSDFRIYRRHSRRTVPCLLPE
jgi:uncharacterized protein